MRSTFSKIKLGFVVAFTLGFSSCDTLFYDIEIVNNTATTLHIWEMEDGDPYEKIGTVGPNDRITEKGFYTGSEYQMQVRLFDGTVIATRVFEKQDNPEDKSWVID